MDLDILGFDSGLHGGVVRLGMDRSVLALEVMPLADKILDLQALWRIIRDHADGPPVFAYLEKVSARPDQGVSSMFKFGRGYGALEAMLVAAGIPYKMVTPQKWQKSMHAGVERSLDPKARSRVAAGRLFPEIDLRKNDRCRVPHEGLVDGLLIAEFGRQEMLRSEIRET